MGNRNARPEITPGAENLPFMPNIGRDPNSLPSYVAKTLQQNGHVRIRSIRVVRTPIQTALRKVLSALSFGAFENAVAQAGYDKLYHLDLWINDTIRFGKETNVRLDYTSPIVQGLSEYIDVPLPQAFHDPEPWRGVNIATFVQKTSRRMGDADFYGYNAKTNNCQDFVLAALAANGCDSPSVVTFVKQNAIQIFSNMPDYVARWAGNITDLGEWVDSLMYPSTPYSQSSRGYFSEPFIYGGRKATKPPRDLSVGVI